VPVVRTLAALVIVGLGGVGAWIPAASGAGSAPAARHPGASGPTLTLVAPPTIAGPSSPFALRLRVSDAAAGADLTLRVTVYDHVSTSTGFDETLKGTPQGRLVAGPEAVALSALPPDTSAGVGSVDLTVPVSAGGTSGAGSGPFTVHLDCAPGSCGGVYPLQLELTDASSSTVVSKLLTYLVYTDPQGDTEPLRFALVLPVDLPPAPGGSSVVMPSLTTSSLTTLDTVIAAAAGSRGTVPLTIVPSPATVAALAADTGARARQTLAALVSVATSSDRQTLCGSFVPVDAGALAGAPSATTTELAEQVHRGVQVLASIPALRAGCATGNAWVSDSTLDASALGALGALGDNDIVIPPGAVAGPSPAITPTQRFTLAGAPATGSALLSDPQLASLVQSTSPTDPALAADQLLAELEFDYSEAPNTPFARGVVAALTPAAPINPAVLTDVLDGLQNNPMVAPVTLATLFSAVPVGGTVAGFHEPPTRRAASGGSPPGPPAAAIAAARARWTGFATAVSGTSAGAVVATGLGDLLLEAESDLLSPAQQRTGVAAFETALSGQLGLLSITSREVRLTASTGSVPITVIKSAPYPVEAVLTVTSDKIAFSSGSAQDPNSECRPPVVVNVANRSSMSTQCTFVHGTNAVYVQMRSRVSGDFRMAVTLNSPQGGLQLASGQVTVRSLSTSGVAIALSAAAGAVLLGWWGRTMWRTRRSRRGVHSRRGAER
jgi:hypothetical protein